nr:acetylornithine deacetylase [uncultured bacterium]
MAQVVATENIKTLELRTGTGSLGEVALFLLLVGLALVAVYRMSPPSVVSSQAPATDFSSERAMQHLKVITEQPHPVGSSEHARVRAYITGAVAALGLNPEVQEASVAAALRRNLVRGGTVKNVLARLEGTDATQHKALLLVGHYDSRMNSFGASDDGAAVAAMLETMRALKSGAALKNDVIFLFTDAEEFGMLGAEAFIGQHPWAKDVGLALNFEARGTRGPAVMFETSNGNGRLIEGLAEAAPHPVTNSLLYEIYRTMPNDTDLTVFKAAGLAGMNFAYINQPTSYHTSLDNYANIDERSLQHQGSYALSLARHFGNQDLSAPKTGNSIYFDLLGLMLARYPATWALPLAALVTLLFAGVFVYGRRTGALTLGGTTVAFGAFLLSLVVIPAIVAGLWWVFRAFNSNYRAMPQGDVYNSQFLYLGFVAISAAVFAAVFALLRRKVRVENLTAGAAFAWLLLLWATSLMLPGASYLFAWPLAFSLLALAWRFNAESPASSPASALKSVGASALGALPAIVLVVPVIYLLFIALTIRMAAVAVVVLVLLLGLLVPQFHLLTRRKSWLLPYVLVSVGAIFLGIGVAASGFNRDQPKQNDIFYGMDADTGKAVWGSTDPRPDAWSAQFFGRTPERGTLEAYFPGLPRPFMKQDAPATDAPAPEVRVLEDNSRDGVRLLRLKIVSPRQAPLMSVYADAQTEVQRVAINGRQLAAAPTQAVAGRQEPWVLRYYGLPSEGIEVTLELKSSAPLKLRVVDQSYGLPAVGASPATARPEGMMPAALPYSDSMLVSKSFAL